MYMYIHVVLHHVSCISERCLATVMSRDLHVIYIGGVVLTYMYVAKRPRSLGRKLCGKRLCASRALVHTLRTQLV